MSNQQSNVTTSTHVKEHEKLARLTNIPDEALELMKQIAICYDKIEPEFNSRKEPNLTNLLLRVVGYHSAKYNRYTLAAKIHLKELHKL